MDPIGLEIFRHLFISVAEQMGATLCRTAHSPNIKERRDYSCACFLAGGQMVAQAAHIPVHLGAMPASVRSVRQAVAAWSPGDLVVLNDPYLGGTHLPDLTMVSPVFVAGADEPVFLVASRAHHSDVGGISPGSMALAHDIHQEGLILPPVKLLEAGRPVQGLLDTILRNTRTPHERQGDLAAQMAAHQIGGQRLQEIVARYGCQETLSHARELLQYAERLTRAAIRRIPPGAYVFGDRLDDDGSGRLGSSSVDPPAIRVSVRVERDCLSVDFEGTSPAVAGSLNAVRAVTESATWYAARCVLDALSEINADPGSGSLGDCPLNSGAFAPICVSVPRGSLLDAEYPHAVAAGNVETSQRVVDVVLGALALALPDVVPAASQGTMNNLSIGGYDHERGVPFAYYETVGGGAGAGPAGPGLSGVHVHMTNTLNTPAEAMEYAYPLRVVRYSLRRGSGGRGRHSGGDGLVREIQCLCEATATVLSERRRYPPYGLQGGQPGEPGANLLLRGEHIEPLAGKVRLDLRPGDVIGLHTPGGGGWGEP